MLFAVDSTQPAPSMPLSPDTATVIKFGVPGLLVGAVLTVLIGIKSELLVPKDTAEKMAQAAVVTAKAQICVGQFSNGPNLHERLKEFKRLNFIQRDDFIEQGGWDRMPGEEKASSEVNRACGDRIAELAAP